MNMGGKKGILQKKISEARTFRVLRKTLKKGNRGKRGDHLKKGESCERTGGGSLPWGGGEKSNEAWAKKGGKRAAREDAEKNKSGVTSLKGGSRGRRGTPVGGAIAEGGEIKVKKFV